MSEDFNQLPGEPERPGQARAEAGVPQEPAREPQPTPLRPQAPSESIIPEQPGAAQPQYPPPPEFYTQKPAAPPQAASFPPLQPPVAGSPGFPPFVQGAPGFPPPPLYGYGVQPSAYDFPPSQAQPLPLGQALRELPQQYKKILFKPGVRAFAEEQGKAEWGITWLQILFLLIMQVGASIPLFLAYNQALATNPSLVSAGVDASIFSSPAFFAVEIVLEALFVPLIFLAGVGIQYLVAKAFKGMGSFKRQAYNQLLFQVPLGLVSAAISLVLSTFIGRTLAASFNVSLNTSATTPILNGPLLLVVMLFDLISLAIGVYSTILTVFSVMAVHRLSGGRATAAVLIPYGVLILVGMLCACVVFVVAASSMVH